MNRALTATLLGALWIVTVGCKSKTDDRDAIRTGVIKYLTSLNMLNINAMDIKVTQATVKGNQAQAQVEIRAKSGDPAGSSMQLNYSLEKRGDERETQPYFPGRRRGCVRRIPHTFGAYP